MIFLSTLEQAVAKPLLALVQSGLTVTLPPAALTFGA